MCALLNYTTSIAAAKTVGEVQHILANHGASRITVDYDSGNPVAIAFELETVHGLRTFRLPANIAGVQATLERQANLRQIPARLATLEQAARVGWRIVKDWVEAQIAIIEAGMVHVDEVMLPYMLTPAGTTVYEAYEQHELQLLTEGD